MLTMLEKTRYGTEIIEMVSFASDGEVQINFGSLYPTIERLKKRGFIEETNHVVYDAGLKIRGGHRRKYHNLTEKGRLALARATRFRSALRSMAVQLQTCL